MLSEGEAPTVTVGPSSLVVFLIASLSGCENPADHAPTPNIAGDTRTITFSSDEEGRVPSGWQTAQTGKGDGSLWKVVPDESGPSKTGYVVAQTAESPRAMFNLCVLKARLYRNVKLTVAFKAVRGKVDQGGGLAWRYVDANNYYMCRYNPLEDNLRIYRVIAGKRQQLASGDVTLPAGQWHTLKVVTKDDVIVCDIGGTQVSAGDASIPDAGQIGLWTKADAHTYFDNLTITGIPK